MEGGGLVIRILQSLGKAGIAVAWDVVAGYLVVFMGKTQPSQCLSPPGIINGYRRIVREVWWNAGGGGNLASQGRVVILLVASCYMKTGISFTRMGK